VEACRAVHESKAPLLLLARASWYVIEGLSLVDEAIFTESLSRHVAKRFTKAQNAPGGGASRIVYNVQ
jgi:hypothetical protein